MMITETHAHQIAREALFAGRVPGRIGVRALTGGWRCWIEPDPTEPARVGSAHLLVSRTDGAACWCSAVIDDREAGELLAEPPHGGHR